MIEIVPGATDLNHWRRIWRGEEARLDARAYSVIARGAEAVEAIVARGEPVYGINTGFGKLASVRIDKSDLAALQKNIILSHAAGVGPAAPDAVVRLMMALKIGSLAQGVSGVRVETIQLLESMLSKGVIPVVPSQGSVGASGDLAPLAHMAAAMIGVGDVRYQGKTVPALKALAEAGLTPATPAPKEGLALLNGTQFSTAAALAALFRLDELFRTALIAGALATDAARGSDAPFDARIHAVRRHRGQMLVAEALRNLMAGSAIRSSHLTGDDRVQDPYCIRCQPQVLGAVYDFARHAAEVLATEADGVSDNPLVFPEDGVALSGGNFHAEPVAFAADTLAIVLCEIGSLAERRVAMLVDPAVSGLPAFLTPKPGLHSGFMIPQVTAAALVAENKLLAHPASVDSLPTCANQEDHVSMAAHAACRLERMLENAESIVAIELLAAAQGCDLASQLKSSEPLERVRGRIRQEIPMWTDDRHFAPDLAAAIALVRNRDILHAVAPLMLPSFVSDSDG